MMNSNWKNPLESWFFFKYFSVARINGHGGNVKSEQVRSTLRCLFNPLSPHDALKHHFTSLKKYLIFLQPGVLERKFP